MYELLSKFDNKTLAILVGLGGGLMVVYHAVPDIFATFSPLNVLMFAIMRLGSALLIILPGVAISDIVGEKYFHQEARSFEHILSVALIATGGLIYIFYVLVGFEAAPVDVYRYLALGSVGLVCLDILAHIFSPKRR